MSNTESKQHYNSKQVRNSNRNRRIMNVEWVGKSVTIECRNKLGDFQGIICNISREIITLFQVFHNGRALQPRETQIQLRASEIKDIKPLNIKVPMDEVKNTEARGVQSTYMNETIQNSSEKRKSNLSGEQKRIQNGAIPKNNNQIKISVAEKIAMALQKSTANLEQNQNGTISNDMAAACSNMNAMSLKGENASNNGNCVSFFEFIGKTNNESAVPDISLNDSAIVATSTHSSFSPTGQKSNGHGSNIANTNNSNILPAHLREFLPPQIEFQMARSGFLRENGKDDNNAQKAHNIDTAGSSQKATFENDMDANFFQDNRNGYVNRYNRNVKNGGLNNRSNGAPANIQGKGNNTKFNNNKVDRMNRNKNGRRCITNENNRIPLNNSYTFNAEGNFDKEFDFERNLALFNKAEEFEKIEKDREQKGEMAAAKPRNYRHDQNIIKGPAENFSLVEDPTDSCERTGMFVTDDGVLVKSISHVIRTEIQSLADKEGLTFLRQMDILARGAVNLVFLVMGTHRMRPENVHQWPVIVIICNNKSSLQASFMGAATGRHFAAHGLKVILYSEEREQIFLQQDEIKLFKATGNAIVFNVEDIPRADQVIVVSPTPILSNEAVEWLSGSRAPVLAIDPPPSGIHHVKIRCSITPVLPLTGMSSINCGRIHLVNVGIPIAFFHRFGIDYKSPFGHKFVLRINSIDTPNRHSVSD